MSDAVIMMTVVVLHIPGVALLVWLLRDLARSDPAQPQGDSGGGGRRVPEPQPPGYRWTPRRGRGRPSPRPRRPARRGVRAAG